jgi:hypothetical protein
MNVQNHTSTTLASHNNAPNDSPTANQEAKKADQAQPKLKPTPEAVPDSKS